MKNRVLLLVVCSLLVFFTAELALAEWQIEFDAEANRVLHLGGQTRRGHFATEEQCRAYWASLPAFERQHSRCVGYDTPSSTPRSPTPKTPTINWPALEAKYFAEADQKGWTWIWIASGTGEKRYYRKENGNWVQKSSEAEAKQPYTTPEEQRRLIQKREERRAKEQRERELEPQREFQLGKRKLLKMLKGLALKPAPIVDLSDKYDQSQNFNMQNEEQIQEEAQEKPTIGYLGDYILDKSKEGAIELADIKAPGIKDYYGKIGDAISILKIGRLVKAGKYDEATASGIEFAVGKLVSGTGNIALQGGQIYSEFTKRVADKAFDSIHEFGKEFGFKSPTGQELRDEMRESESFGARVTMILLGW